MQSALLDTGALVAIVNRRDRYHAQIAALLKDYEGRFLTTWPVVSEACSFMPDRLQGRVLDWIAVADVEIVSIDAGIDFMRKRWPSTGICPATLPMRAWCMRHHRRVCGTSGPLTGISWCSDCLTALASP